MTRRLLLGLFAMVVFPVGWKRTAPSHRRRSRFETTFARARNGILAELKRIGATGVRIDTDIALRRDGLPYANEKMPDDTGVVIYWMRHAKKYALACDAWSDVGSNMRAIELTLKAKRDVERWGAATAEAEYAGYEALPPPSGAPVTQAYATRAPHEVLGVSTLASKAEVIAAFRTKAHLHHPDKGGDRHALEELVMAKDALLGGDSP